MKTILCIISMITINQYAMESENPRGVKRKSLATEELNVPESKRLGMIEGPQQESTISLISKDGQQFSVPVSLFRKCSDLPVANGQKIATQISSQSCLHLINLMQIANDAESRINAQCILSLTQILDKLSTEEVDPIIAHCYDPKQTTLLLNNQFRHFLYFPSLLIARKFGRGHAIKTKDNKLILVGDLFKMSPILQAQARFNSQANGQILTVDEQSTVVFPVIRMLAARMFNQPLPLEEFNTDFAGILNLAYYWGLSFTGQLSSFVLQDVDRDNFDNLLTYPIEIKKALLTSYINDKTAPVIAKLLIHAYSQLQEDNFYIPRGVQCLSMIDPFSQQGEDILGLMKNNEELRKKIAEQYRMEGDRYKNKITGANGSFLHILGFTNDHNLLFGKTIPAQIGIEFLAISQLNEEGQLTELGKFDKPITNCACTYTDQLNKLSSNGKSLLINHGNIFDSNTGQITPVDYISCTNAWNSDGSVIISVNGLFKKNTYIKEWNMTLFNLKEKKKTKLKITVPNVQRHELAKQVAFVDDHSVAILFEDNIFLVIPLSHIAVEKNEQQDSNDWISETAIVADYKRKVYNFNGQVPIRSKMIVTQDYFFIATRSSSNPEQAAIHMIRRRDLEIEKTISIQNLKALIAGANNVVYGVLAHPAEKQPLRCRLAAVNVRSSQIIDFYLPATLKKNSPHVFVDPIAAIAATLYHSVKPPENLSVMTWNLNRSMWASLLAKPAINPKSS